jgi:4,5-DOPA dioxygenase extradiol
MALSSDWHQALEALTATPEKIPAFFFAHGSPMLAYPAAAKATGGMAAYQGPNGPLAKFLSEFGPTLLKKYKPKGIVVFSAHWETTEERLGKSLVYISSSVLTGLINQCPTIPKTRS